MATSENPEQGSLEDVPQLTIEGMRLELIRHYPHLTDEKEIGRITLRHYQRLMKASSLRALDREYEIHLSAWKNREIEAVKGKHYIYRDFRKFMDYRKREAALLGQTPPKPKSGNKLMYLMAKANQTKREGG